MRLATRALVGCSLLALMLTVLAARAVESAVEEGPGAVTPVATAQSADKPVTEFQGMLKKFAFKSADDVITFSAEPLGPVPDMSVQVRSRGRSAFVVTFCTTPFDWDPEEVFSVRARIDGADMAPGSIGWATDIPSAGDDAFAARSFVSCAQWGMDRIAAGLHTVEIHAGITPGTVKLSKRTLFVRWTK